MEIIGSVCRTKEYGAFRILPGNRDILDRRVNKVKASIEKYGYIFNPIIVNRKMEIIDGQARYTALQELGLPVDYIVSKEDLGARECVALNASGTNWNNLDYIKSGSAQGKENYVYLLELMNKYKPQGMTDNAIMYAVTKNKVRAAADIKRDNFSMDRKEFERANKELEYAVKFCEKVKKVQSGNKTPIYVAIIFVFRKKLIDQRRLLRNFTKYYGTDVHKNYTNQREAIEALEEIYNYKQREKAFFYPQFVASKD